MLKIKGPAEFITASGETFTVTVDIQLPPGLGKISSDRILEIAHIGEIGTLRWGNMQVQAIVTEGRGDGTGRIATSGQPTPA